MVWAALSFTTHLPLKSSNLPCVIQVVRVSGTIRKAEEEAIRRARLQIRLAQRTTGGEANAAVKAVDDVVDGERDLAMLGGIEDFGGEEESDGWGWKGGTAMDFDPSCGRQVAGVKSIIWTATRYFSGTLPSIEGDLHPALTLGTSHWGLKLWPAWLHPGIRFN
jgi:hypothetical protein